MGPRAEQGILEPPVLITEKTPLIGGDAPVRVLLPDLPPPIYPTDKLSAKELDEFITDPFWVRVRWTCFICYWLLFCVMLLASMSMSMAVGCSPPPLVVPTTSDNVFPSSTSSSFAHVTPFSSASSPSPT